MTGHILILTNNIGGLHSFRKEVIKAIVDSGYKVTISAPDDDERKEYFKEIGCTVIRTRFNRRSINPFADLRLMLRYRQYIKQLRPTAVLTYTIKPNIYGGLACRLSGVPLLANITGLGDAIENGGWLQKLAINLYRIGIGKAKRVFFQNKSNQETCIRMGIADESSKLLPGSGVNLEYHLAQPYPQEQGVIKFLYMGRLLKDKGIEELFCAAEKVKSRHPNVEFLVLGDCEGNYQEELYRLQQEGIINHLGTTTDVRPYIGEVHCTIMPSYHEGMSNVNLESAANARPVITTDVPGCRETVDNKVTGLLVKAKDTESLIEAIEHFILLPYEERRKMGLAAREKMEKEFDRRIVIDAYIQEINDIRALS